MDKAKFYFMYQDDSGFENRKNVRYDLSEEIEVSVMATHQCGSHYVTIKDKARIYPGGGPITPS